ncbi:MAG: hypothetical protein OQJ89_12305 [Kangiellaceae bacterium]|nr:hypothetical protein [Kangiellaceae bacterium]MCW8999260.1 hypothetical protein [Kangiellaceae bacterium]MCW9017743.1 hypothetical protein [Kangiellaceae bacterium]
MFMMYKRLEKIEEVFLSDCFTNADAIKVRQELEFIICRGSSKLLLDISELNSIERKAASLIYYCSNLCSKRNGAAVILNPSKKVMSVLNSFYLKSPLSFSFDKNQAIERLGA